MRLWLMEVIKCGTVKLQRQVGLSNKDTVYDG